MKKILLSFVGVACALLSNAQLILNEVYVRPNPNKDRQEFFELKNTAATPENADCYTLVSYFNDNGQRGFYVVNIPARTVAGNGYLVSSSQSPSFHFQDSVSSADFSWNDGNINRYVYTNGTLVLNNTGAPYTDIFLRSGGNTNGGGNGLYAVFLFKGSTLADAFLGAHNSIVVPEFITMLGQLTNTAGNGDACGALSYNFNNINNEADELFNQVTEAAGTDNGYYRQGGGCGNNGVWVKSSSTSEHTPGKPNPGNRGSATQAEMIQAEVNCVDNVSVSYNITGGSSQAFPVKVSLYFDANGSQFLDAGDVLLGQQTDNNVNEPTKSFSKDPSMEDFIFVFDGKGDCYDTLLRLNCPAAIILPVTFSSFTASKSGSTVSLKWTTASEINNRGFNVQRLQGNGNWETLGFVSSQATGGNSQSALTYTYTDGNLFKGVTQYRLQQVDIDGRMRYSDIRTIRSEGVAGKTSIFPNPSNGAANIVFGNTSSSHDVMISDMNGRVVKQFRNITDNTMKVDNLTPGVYMIRIVDRDGSQSNERLVVSGR